VKDRGGGRSSKVGGGRLGLYYSEGRKKELLEELCSPRKDLTDEKT